MKKPLAFVIAVVALPFLHPTQARAATRTFTAVMNGANERPTPITTNATGTAILTIDDVANRICGTVTYENLSGPILAMQLHVGEAETTGPILQAFPVGPSPLSVSVANVSSAMMTILMTRDTYVNIHAGVNSGGEIRGQLLPGGEEQPCGGPVGGVDGGPKETPDGPPRPEVRPPADAGAATAAPGRPPADEGCATTGSSRAMGGSTLLVSTLAFLLCRRRQRRLPERKQKQHSSHVGAPKNDDA